MTSTSFAAIADIVFRRTNRDCGFKRYRHDLWQPTMETTMQKIFLTAIFIPLAAALTAQAASASEHHARTTDRAVLSEQVRDSNAYAAPGDIALPARAADYDEGAMASGPAGH
jgi:hypothetical protein